MTKKRSDRFEVLQPGISISSKYCRTGTLGLIVFDKKNDFKPCILSNWHILSKRNKFFSSKAGKPIYQPGKVFLKSKGQWKRRKNFIAARLTRQNKATDSAIAKIVNRSFDLSLFETDKQITSTRIPKVGDIVEKSGARTGVTKGKIVEVVGNWVKIKPISIDNPENEEISKGGDSGSVWYDPETKEGLVLHSVGEGTNSDPKAEYAGGYILQKVLDNLDVSLTRPV